MNKKRGFYAGLLLFVLFLIVLSLVFHPQNSRYSITASIIGLLPIEEMNDSGTGLENQTAEVIDPLPIDVDNPENQIEEQSPPADTTIEETQPLEIQVDTLEPTSRRVSDIGVFDTRMGRDISSGREVIRGGKKFSNNSNIILSVPTDLECRIFPDSVDDQWKECETVFEVESFSSVRASITSPLVDIIASRGQFQNITINFSNTSTPV